MSSFVPTLPTNIEFRESSDDDLAADSFPN
jgi:hypothetical protein